MQGFVDIIVNMVLAFLEFTDESDVIGFKYVEESILGEGTNLNKVIERNGKHGLYGSEGTCLIVVEIFCWRQVLKVIVVGHLWNALNSHLNLWEIGWNSLLGLSP